MSNVVHGPLVISDDKIHKPYLSSLVRMVWLFFVTGFCNGGFTGCMDGEEPLSSLCCHRGRGSEPPAAGSGQSPRGCHCGTWPVLSVPRSLHHTAQCKKGRLGCCGQVSVCIFIVSCIIMQSSITTSPGFPAELGNIPQIYIHEKKMAAPTVITF